MPKKFASVLCRVPGNPDWIVEDFRIKAKGFDLAELQAMAGGNCFYENFALNQTYHVICDEEGRLKKLPVCMGLQLTNGNTFPLFGPFAVVRNRESKNGDGMFEYCGLEPEDLEVVKTKFAWVTV